VNNIVRYSLAASILAIGMIISAGLISRFFVRVKHEKEIIVKGFAKAPITADVGELQVTVYVREGKQADAYQVLTRQMTEILGKVKESSPDDLDVEFQNPGFDERYKLNEKGVTTNEIESYLGNQTVTFTSSDVHWIKQVSQKLNKLIGEGYDIRVHAPTYLVSNLAEIKQELIKQATADGHRRAQVMAKNSSAKVGSLRAARQGVFQITEPNSTETSDYGRYDTSTIEKSIKAVVTLEYAIE